MKTNRDFYKAIATLLKEKKNQSVISLEHYLVSLWFRAQEWKAQNEIPLEVFYGLLVAAFSPVQESVEEKEIDGKASGYLGWDSLIRRQIKDLQQMRENGQLEDEERYFGIQGPSGDWYNFDPCAYIECATAGSLGGWEEGDQTGRQYVPGQVAALNDKGEIVSCNPQDLDSPPKEIGSISWDDFTAFLWCGQHYE